MGFGDVIYVCINMEFIWSIEFGDVVYVCINMGCIWDHNHNNIPSPMAHTSFFG